MANHEATKPTLLPLLLLLLITTIQILPNIFSKIYEEEEENATISPRVDGPVANK